MHMKSPVSGLSLIIHLAIIALATLLGFLIGTQRRDAVTRVFAAQGGTVAHRAILQMISISIIVILGTLMLFATTVAIKTGIREGAREPQVIFVKRELRQANELFATTWEDTLEHVDAVFPPEFTTNSFTFTRTTVVQK